MILSIDGFRYDYPELFNLSFLQKLKAQSYSQKPLAPVHPSKTFPNHLSMVTGLYPDEHGIVGNVFYNKRREKLYSIAIKESKRDPLWYSAEPIWISLEKEGLLTASYFWPTSEVFYDGLRPSYLRIWDEETDLTIEDKSKLDQVMEWFKLPEENRPRLILAYLAQIDQAGHHSGPESQQLKRAAQKLDQQLKLFIEQLKTLDFEVNLILCSDHGMIAVDKQNFIYLSDYITLPKNTRAIGHGALTHLYFETEEEILRAYEELSKREHSEFQVYLREEIPEHYHLKGSENTGDLVIITHYPHYMLESRDLTARDFGDHGYDPRTVKEMQGIYYTIGSALKKTKSDVKETKDIYNVLRKLYHLD